MGDGLALRRGDGVRGDWKSINGNDFEGDVFGGDMLPFFFPFGETFEDFLGAKRFNGLLGLGICTTAGFKISVTNGDMGFTSFIRGLGFGGDIFFEGAGGEGGGGAALRAGIVIGEGTF